MTAKAQEAFGRGGGVTPQDWATPWNLFHAIEARYGKFDVDVCATHHNTKVPEKYYTPEIDGLSQDWGTMLCFANPPYAGDAARFARKSVQSARAGATVVMLVFVRSDTAWFQSCAPHATGIDLIKGRIAFERGSIKAPAPMASCLLVFTPAGGPPKLSFWDWRNEGQVAL